MSAPQLQPSLFADAPISLRRLPVISSGGVAWREHDGRIEVCLLCPPDGNLDAKRWAIPRGRMNEDERIRDAAVRQVQRRTGVLGRVQKSFERVDVGHGESSYFFLMKVSAKSGDCLGEPEAAWIPLDVAPGLVATRAEAEVLTRIRRYLGFGLVTLGGGRRTVALARPARRTASSGR